MVTNGSITQVQFRRDFVQAVVFGEQLKELFFSSCQSGVLQCLTIAPRFGRSRSDFSEKLFDSIRSILIEGTMHQPGSGTIRGRQRNMQYLNTATTPIGSRQPQVHWLDFAAELCY